MTRNGHTVIDIHQHVGEIMGTPASGGGKKDPSPVDTTVDGDEIASRLDTMEANGIDQAFVIPAHEYLRPNGLADTQRVNDAIARYRDDDPERFPAAVGVTEPFYGKAGLDEIDRCSRELGLIGISLHAAFQGVYNDTSLVVSIVETTIAAGMTPFIHVAAGAPYQEALWKLIPLARQWPEARFVALDAFSSYERAKEARLVVESTENVYFDTALLTSIRILEDFVTSLGADRVMFGTDLYSRPFAYRRAHVLDWILESTLSDDQQAAVLSDNAARLFMGGEQ